MTSGAASIMFAPASAVSFGRIPDWKSIDGSRCDSPPFELRDATSRRVVRDAIVKVCDFRSVPLYALHVRTNHVHGVVEAEDARRVLHDWKAYATRSLRDAGLVAPDRVVWTHGGNASPLRSSASVRAAIRYVLEGQGEGMETYCGG